VLTLRRIDIAVGAGRLADAAADYEAYRERMVVCSANVHEQRGASGRCSRGRCTTRTTPRCVRRCSRRRAGQ